MPTRYIRATIGGVSKTTTLEVSDPVTQWPNASNTGPRVATTRTIAGASITDTSWFAANGFTGAGTATNPYLVSKVLFTSTVTLGDWDPTNLGGKVVKFVDCRFYGSPGNPTPPGSSCVNVRETGPKVILEYCHLGPNATPAATGGPPSSKGGTDKGFQSYVPFEMRYCNVWGACILVYFETPRTASTSVIEDNYLHDVWTSAGDHSDCVNGNWHASHIIARRNYIDGIRTGNTFVTNGFGIYDDPVSSASGIIEDWTIEGNYITRCATGLLCTNSTSRFLNPFVVKDNVWGQFSLQRYSGRAPSAQSGNKDTSGNALSF